MSTRLAAPSPYLVSLRYAQQFLGGRSRQWFYDRWRDDPTFPKPVRTGAHKIEIVLPELRSWAEGLPRAEFTGADAITQRRVSAASRKA